MSRLLALLLLATAVRAADPAPLIPKDAPPPGAVIVELHTAGDLDRFRRDLGEIDRRAGKRALGSLRYAYRSVLPGAAIELDARDVDAVRRLPYVRAVHPDRIVTMFAAGADGRGEGAARVRTVFDPAAARPNATVAPALRANETINAAARVNALSLPTRGEGIRVGVIDSGIDYLHPALGGGFGPGFKVAGGWDFVGNDAAPLDENGHGTHVAGIIAADSPELAGVAPAATLYAYRVLNGMGQGRQSDVLAAIERSIDPNQDGNPADHLDVINLSLGSLGTADDLPSRAVDRATAAGVVVVVAAGNEGAFASVRSPGTARTAITVGAINDAGVVAAFSSRGPSPENLALKPDLVAPGEAVVSARIGGGVVAMDGTSMAAPHVAGVAALLVKLNPDWTPAEIKSAMITSASPVDAPVFARAAGRVDAAAATLRSTFADSAGLSFGLAFGRTGTWTATRTVQLTNRGTTPRAFDVVATNLPAGATLVATPASLQIAPGATQSVELRMTLDNASVAFPGDHAYGGSVELRGTETLKLPWMLVRAGRITGRFEGGGQNLRGISGGTTVAPLMYSGDRGEIFGVPGTKWDLFMTTYQADDEGYATASQIVAFEDRELAGDEVVVFRRSDATAKLTIDGRDAYGRNLNLQARGARAAYFQILAIHYTKDGHDLELGYLSGGVPELFLSPLSPSFVIHAIESYADMGSRELYNVQHPPLHGLAQSTTLTAGRSSYVRARFRFNDKGKPDYLFGPCPSYDVQESGPYPELHSLICPAYFLSEPFEVDYYTTSESGTAKSGFIIGTNDLVIPTLRGIDGRIVSAEFEPSPAAYRVGEGEHITIGNQPFFPVSFFGTNGGSPPRLLLIRSGFNGALGDWQYASNVGTTWTMTSAQGQTIASGTLTSLYAGAPLPVPGARFTAVREGLTVGGRPSRGEVEARYGDGGLDFRAPSLTAFRIVDSAGRIGDAMRLNDRVSVEFAAADWDFADNTASKPLKREATRAWYRASGTSEWIAATPVLTAEDSGSLHELGRIPAGDVYRAELASATNVLGAVDVRVEVEDAEGNRTTWTQAPAFYVESPKRRAVQIRR